MSALYICKQHSADVFMNTVKEIMSLRPARSCFMYAIAKVKKKKKKTGNPLGVNVHQIRIRKPDNHSRPPQLGVADRQIYSQTHPCLSVKRKENPVWLVRLTTV